MLTFSLALISLTGCAINNHGFAPFFSSSSTFYPHARRDERIVRGLYFYTDQGIGLHVGYLKLVRIFPQLVSDHSGCLVQPPSAGFDLLSAAPGDHPFTTREALHDSLGVGAGLALRGRTMTAHVGLRRRIEVRMERGAQAVYLFDITREENEQFFCATSFPGKGA